MQTKTKVYLAKSNLVNTGRLNRVREYLQDFDIEIIEFKGGQYSNKPLLQCEYLVIVPESLQNKRNNIDKGLTCQIDDFSVKDGNMDKIVMVGAIIKGTPYLYPIVELDAVTIDWQSNYSNVILGARSALFLPQLISNSYPLY